MRGIALAPAPGPGHPDRQPARARAPSCKSLRAASEALARGEVVCIFAEGGITRTGFLLPFQRGFEQIVKRLPGADRAGLPRPRLGQHLQLPGRHSSSGNGRRSCPIPVSVAFGAAVAADDARPSEVRQADPEAVGRRRRSSRGNAAGRCIASSCAWPPPSVSSLRRSISHQAARSSATARRWPAP